MINFLSALIFAYKAPKLYDLTYPIADIDVLVSRDRITPGSLFLQLEKRGFYRFVRHLSPPIPCLRHFQLQRGTIGPFRVMATLTGI